MRKGIDYEIGVDEVGRGPLAGPVAVSAALIRKKDKRGILGYKPKLKDSKKLSQKQREIWFKKITEMKNDEDMFCEVVYMSPKTIDKINISRAVNIASGKAIERVIKKSDVNKNDNVRIYTDGGIRPFFKSKNPPVFDIKTIIKGDEKIPIVSIASIFAKVSRDRYMQKLGKKYKKYGFDVHKGYGTKMHIEAIKKHGPSDIHRLTFIKRWVNINR